jgi:hypothetical protein
VATEHDDDSSPILFCGRDGVNDATEIARDENVGKRFEKGGEASISARRRGKLSRDNFVRAPLDWNGADFGEIGFRDGPGCRPP